MSEAAEYFLYREAWDELSPEQQQRVRDKAAYEHVSLFGVWHDWPSLFAASPVPEEAQ